MAKDLFRFALINDKSVGWILTDETVETSPVKISTLCHEAKSVIPTYGHRPPRLTDMNRVHLIHDRREQAFRELCCYLRCRKDCDSSGPARNHRKEHSFKSEKCLIPNRSHCCRNGKTRLLLPKIILFGHLNV